MKIFVVAKRGNGWEDGSGVYLGCLGVAIYLYSVVRWRWWYKKFECLGLEKKTNIDILGLESQMIHKYHMVCRA